MDILNISPPVSGNIFSSGSQDGSRPVAKAAPVLPQPAPAPVPVPENAEQARYAEVQRAAQSVQTNYYVVSDVRFTIFKDIAGDYVTRFTSLKDGSVKYYPQKSLFELMQIRNAPDKAAFHTEA